MSAQLPTPTNGTDDRYDLKDSDYSTYPLVESNPVNRDTYFSLYHHTDYEADEIQTNLSDGLDHIKTDYQDHALCIGGDQLRTSPLTDDLQKRLRHIVIQHTGSHYIATYEQIGSDERVHLDDKQAVIEFLDDLFIPSVDTSRYSFVCVGLIALEQTIFNSPAHRSTQPAPNSDDCETDASLRELCTEPTDRAQYPIDRTDWIIGA